MKKRGIQSNLSSGELSKFGKMSKKELGKSIGGNPDATDEGWIKTWVELYEKAFPGQIRRMSNDVATEIALSNVDKHAVVNKDSGMRKAFWLPENLQEVLEAAYPSFWTNPKHAQWFCDHFPQFAFATYARRVK